MGTPEFHSFKEILKPKLLSVTQKIHGSNACVYIWDATTDDGKVERKLICGSRKRWITPEDDNYGFAAFVEKHKDEFIEKLKPGRHDGEWAGPGINSGEGLTERRFVLFSWEKFPPERPLPPGCMVVPLLYSGPCDFHKLDEVMDELKANGSKLVPGFMRPEGIVWCTANAYFKRVFHAEETQWRGGDPNYVKPERPAAHNYEHLCQPIRLEHVLSSDEQYRRGYPNTLSDIVRAYVGDLVKEGQITGTPDEIKLIRKQASGQIYTFVKAVMEGTPEKAA
jgi:RNA ligase-like protein